MEKNIFGKGEPASPELSKYFSGKVYFNPLVSSEEKYNFQVINVTFEPGCRNNWHTHSHGQILLIIDGYGWYQEWGKKAQRLKPGDVIKVPSGVKHWHGAGKDTWLSHVVISTSENITQWLEPVSEEEYDNLKE